MPLRVLQTLQIVVGFLHLVQQVSSIGYVTHIASASYIPITKARGFTARFDKDVEASYERIAERAGVSRRTAMRAAKELQQAGLIYIKKVNGFWNKYMFKKFDHAKKADGGDKSTQGGDKANIGGDDKSTQGSDKATQGSDKVVTDGGDKANIGRGDKAAPILDSLNHTLGPDRSIGQLLMALTNYLKAAMSPMQDKPMEIEKLLAHLLTLYPNLQPAHFPAFFRWYRFNIVGENGKAYRLPTKSDKIARHFSNFWRSADRRDTDHAVTVNPNLDYSASELLLTNGAQGKLSDDDYLNRLQAEFPDLFSH